MTLLRRKRSERGVALVAALWASTIIAIITLSISQIVRADAIAQRGREDVAALNAIADAAINLTILAMLGPVATQPPVNDVPVTISFAGRPVRVTVVDEIGKIDLNMAREDILLQLFAAVGFESGAATELAGQLTAWRAVGREPTGEPLQSLEQLQAIPGVTQELYRRLRPLATVYSQTAGIDTSYSNLGVLNALRTVDETAAAEWRRAEDARAAQRLPEPRRGVAPGHAYTITAEVGDVTSARMVRTAVIRLTGQSQLPLLVYRWN